MSRIFWFCGLGITFIPIQGETLRILLIGCVLSVIFLLNLKRLAFINFGICFVLFFTTALGFLNLTNISSLRGTSLHFALPQEVIDETTQIFLLACLLIVTFPKSQTHLVVLKSINSNKKNFSFTNLFLAIIPLVIGIIDFGLQGLISRNTHLIGSQTSYIAHLTAPLSLISIGYLSSIGRLLDKRMKSVILIIIGLYGLYFLALSTRRIAIIPFAVVLLLFDRRKKMAKLFAFLLATYSSMLLINLVLNVRAEYHQGLRYYFPALFSNNIFNVELMSVFQNFISSFQITGITAFVLEKYPLKDLLIEINPLPGNIAGWYEILNRHSINAYTPTSSIGDLANYGIPIFVLGLVLVSYMGMRCGDILVRASREKDTLIAGIIVSSTLMTLVNSLQYSLRSSMRLILYSLTIYLGIIIYRKRYSSMGKDET